MNELQFFKICKKAFRKIKDSSPIDTGNLRFNAIEIKFINNTTVEIKVNEEIAPYMVYTNEKWISPKWNGRKNPNEQWWNNVIEEFVSELQAELGATVVKE